jgi:hypothetical protein
MESVVGRRVFVGSVVAGVPLLASAGMKAFAQSGAAAPHNHPAAAAAAEDPVLRHLVREIAATHNAARARRPRGEDARALSAQLRTLAVYGKQIDLDGRVRTAVAELVAAQGRETVMFHEVERATRKKSLEGFGFKVEPRALDYAINPDYGTRAAALDALLTGGVSPTWQRMAATLDQMAPELDRRGGDIVAVSARQDAVWYGAFCDALWREYEMAQLMAAPICWGAALPMGAFLAPACVALEGGAMALLFIYLFYCAGFWW